MLIDTLVNEWYNFSISKLNNWRNGYSRTAYPLIIAKNIFYRQYTMAFMWESHIENSFKLAFKSESNILNATQKITEAYIEAKKYFLIGNDLEDLINKKEDIGGINHLEIDLLVEKAQNDNTALEELEFDYIFWLLINETILYWAALGRTGYDMDGAIGKLTGFYNDYSKKYKINYDVIFEILGICQNGINVHMDKLYQPLPVFHENNKIQKYFDFSELSEETKKAIIASLHVLRQTEKNARDINSKSFDIIRKVANQLQYTVDFKINDEIFYPLWFNVAANEINIDYILELIKCNLSNIQKDWFIYTINEIVYSGVEVSDPQLEMQIYFYYKIGTNLDDVKKSISKIKGVLSDNAK